MARIVIRDAANNVIVDESTRLGREVAQHTVTGTSGSFSAPGLVEGDPWWVFATSALGGQPIVGFSGTTVSWTWEGDFVAGVIIVGVY